MKIRIRNRKITKVLDVDENSKLSDLDQFVYGLFDNRIPRLSNRDNGVPFFHSLFCYKVAIFDTLDYIFLFYYQNTGRVSCDVRMILPFVLIFALEYSRLPYI